MQFKNKDKINYTALWKKSRLESGKKMLSKDRRDFNFTLMDDEKRALSAIDKIEVIQAQKRKRLSKKRTEKQNMMNLVHN